MKWLKHTGTGCHQKSWLKMSTTGSKKVWHQLLLVSKIVVGEVLVCEDVQKHIFIKRSSQCGWRVARQIVCGVQMCVQASRLWWLFQVPALRTTKIEKWKSVVWNFLWMICSWVSWSISDLLYQKNSQVYPNLARRCGPRRRSRLLYSTWMMKLQPSVTPNRADALLCVGSARSSSDLTSAKSISKHFHWLETIQAASDASSVSIRQ